MDDRYRTEIFGNKTDFFIALLEPWHHFFFLTEVATKVLKRGWGTHAALAKGD